ncbi:hypothetical protein [Mucilaginibacter sp.]|uniref:hypothetical protein n=1 Tax=Mucilaginibacter sp. TaxID=1882438 RepID=UPI002601D047|nr:hypothetical protein [Mucilaginibacter sp.]MDB4925329.1 UDP-N-acetylglucosamine:LPS N-acetylglucosamine transferase [Mucilaginibacter sp.]
MLTTKQTLARLLLAFSDFILLNVCLYASYHFTTKYGFEFTKYSIFKALIFTWITWFLSTYIFRLYSEYTVYKFKDINKATWRTIVFHLLAIYLLLRSNPTFPPHCVFIYSLIVVCGFLFSRIICIAIMPLVKFNFEKREAHILAIASVGGHWIELLRIMPLFKGKNVTFISNKASLSNTVKDYKFHTVPDANRNNILKLLKCIVSVFGFILILRPQVIITTGAAPGLLGIVVGKILGVKTIWIDSIANVDKLSLSGVIALWLADRVYTQWEHLSNPKIVYSGNIL